MYFIMSDTSNESDLFFQSLKNLKLSVEKKDITSYINDNIKKSNVNLDYTFKQACRENDYLIIDSILESKYNDFWDSNIYIWGLNISCSETNMDSIKYILSKINIKDMHKYDYDYLKNAIKRNGKYALTHLATINPHITFISYDDQKYDHIETNDMWIYILEKKVRIIQQWWKSIYYNPRTIIGKKRLSNEYDLLI